MSAISVTGFVQDLDDEMVQSACTAAQAAASDLQGWLSGRDLSSVERVG